MSAEGFERIYAVVARSRVYREIRLALVPDLPRWLIPTSSATPALLERLVRELRVESGDALVDIACGMGGPAVWFAEQTDAHVTGIDFAPSAIAAARRLAQERATGGQTRFVVADATGTELRAESFDAAVSIDAIVFMDARAVAAEVARLLRRGGRFAFTSWERLAEHPMPTMVADYAPILAEAGFETTLHDTIDGFQTQQATEGRAILARAADLRAELGEPAEELIEEAQGHIDREHEPPRVRKVLVVAEKRHT